MKILLGIGLIIGLLYLGYSYGAMLIQNQQLKMGILPSELEDEVPPVRYIMLYRIDGAQMFELMHLDINAHHEAGWEIEKTLTECEDKIKKIYFDNKDELWMIQGGAQISALTKHERDKYRNKIFIDYNLPAEDIKTLINQLGLVGYMYPFALCKDVKKGK